jgi:hypothetical protein
MACLLLSGLENVRAQAFDPSTWGNKTLTEISLKADPATLIKGRVIAIDRDAACILQTDRGNLHTIFWEDVASANHTETPFKVLTIKELSEELSAESKLSTVTSDHYVVIYRGSNAYAKWIVELYERLYRAFYAYWKGAGIELQEPEFPLVVNVFTNRDGFMLQAREDGVESAEAMIGYYHINTNQTVSYDLTGSQLTAKGEKVGKNALVNLIRSQPGWERTVATIVHESVHQLAYNSGLQVRLADNPLWLSEGIAMFFEAPDLSSSRGWSGIGKANHYQLLSLRAQSAALQGDWITPLIQDDALFADGETVGLAYAQSWALTYYLMKHQSTKFADYMRDIGQGKPWEADDSKARLASFHKHFGSDMIKLQQEVLQKVGKL